MYKRTLLNRRREERKLINERAKALQNDKGIVEIGLHDRLWWVGRLTQISYSGKQWSTARYCAHVAKPSLSQRSVHHDIVTRLPNHMWDTSCATVSATLCWDSREEFSGSINRAVSLGTYANERTADKVWRTMSSARGFKGSLWYDTQDDGTKPHFYGEYIARWLKMFQNNLLNSNIMEHIG